jgi:NAD(P)-dependent dehydrogenase (short-subunit alcohol dehydrogenase family)
MEGKLENAVAVVTGAGQGIGEAIARRFALEGAKVAIAEINPETGKSIAKSINDSGGTAISIPIDVSDSQAVDAMVDKVVDKLGKPTVLVNNAGIAVFGPPLEITDEDWQKCFSVDLDAVWYCSRAVLSHMLESGHGSIVNIASVHSFQIIPHTFPYPVAKHAVVGMTRALAIEYAAKGIRVNAICPAYILTPINEWYFNKFPDPAAKKKETEQLHPVRRLGRPDEVANAALFLASDEASFITGESMMVDGGISILIHDEA